MESLPVQKINYGPLVYEEEEAKVVISAITCKPPDSVNWPEHTTTGKFTTLKAEFTQKIKETKEGHDENYQLLNTALDNLNEKVNQESNINERFEALELQINETIIELKKGINECQTNPCHNQGICSDVQNGYTCTCVPGFTGTNCEVNFDDCSENPCLHGMCMDLINSYKCTCETGYHGSNCDSQTPPCPTSEPNYRIIDSKCYYFEAEYKTYNFAKQNCNTKFPQGKLFEPKSTSSNRKVHKEALSYYPNEPGYPSGYWIGINDKRSEGSWVYDSDGTSVAFSIPWYNGEPNGLTDGGGNTYQNCLKYWSRSERYIGELGDYTCYSLYPSICEQIV